MSGLRLRPATEADAGLLLAWRNQPAAREVPGDTGEVAPEEHERWLTAILAAPDRHQLIAEKEDRPVGQVRLERVGEDEWEIGISIDPGRQGEGLGLAAVEAGCAWLWANTAAAHCLARVHAENAPSLATFARAGFEPSGKPAPEGFTWLTLPRPGSAVLT